MRVITLSGSPRERGRQHGESCREDIHQLIGGWRYAIEKSTDQSLEEWCDDFMANTQFEAAMTRWTPGLLDELAGMAEGADIDPGILYFFNCTDENQWFMEHRAEGLDLPEGRGCSSLGTASLIAQNMDIPGATDGYQVLLRIVEDDNDTYLFSLTGMLGMIGLNRHGIGVVNNSLRQLAVRPDGLPVNVMVRGLLMQPDFDSAKSFIRNAPHATGHNYIIGGPGGSAMFECSAAGAVELPPDHGMLLHTNHPIASEDTSPHDQFRGNRSTSNTEVRLDSLKAQVQGETALTVNQAKAVLAAHDDEANPVCRHVTDKRTNFTAGAVVYEMTVPPTLHIAPGPPCEVPFETYKFQE